LGSKRAASKHRYVNCGRASRSDRIEPSKGHLATETHHTFRTPRSHRAAVHHAVAPGETEPRCKVPVNLATIRSTGASPYRRSRQGAINSVSNLLATKALDAL